MAVLALTAGCGAAPVTPPAPSTTTTSSVVPPSPAQLDARAKSAMAPPGAFDALGGKVAESTPANDSDPGAEREPVALLCRGNSTLFVDSGTSVARSRIWAGGASLFQRVHATSDLPATVLVRGVRNSGDGCALSFGADKVVGNVPIAKPEGVEDSYAYCEANKNPEMVPWSCQLVMARGTLITLVVASGQSQQAAVAQLASVVPTFAETFVKA
jgi:hypothetical protein